MVNNNFFIIYTIYHCLKTWYNLQNHYNEEMKVHTNDIDSYCKKSK